MTNTEVPKLLEQLGPVVLIPNKPGTKEPKRKGWRKKTLADMENPEYLRLFAGANIGLYLTGRLCGIDMDMGEVEERKFLALNPALKDSFRAYGKRGCVVIFRAVADCPLPNGPRDILTRSGGHWGEFRVNHQCIVHGRHPEGIDYRRTEGRLVEFDPRNIVWPTNIANPPEFNRLNTITQRNLMKQRNLNDADESDETEVIKGNVGCGVSAMNARGKVCLGSVRTIEEALKASIPLTVHTNNKGLFILARAILSIEAHQDRKFERAELCEVFDKWYAEATGFLRPNQSKDDYRIEFFKARKAAKHPLGATNINLPALLEEVKKEPLPPDARVFDGEGIKLLVGMSYKLQSINWPEPFFLATRDGAELFGVCNKTVALWQEALVGAEITKIVAKGTANKATRFIYINYKPESDESNQEGETKE